MRNSVVRELRAVQRYSVSLPVCVTWRAPGASPAPLSGFTRDISTRGMFVVADAAPAPGEPLEFEIDMALDAETPLVVVHGEGRVVRAERTPDQPAGFAVHNVWFRLRAPEQGQALPLDVQILAERQTIGIRRGARRGGLAIVPPQVRTDSGQGERND